MLLDLHAYTDLSGGTPLGELARDARAAGLDAICVADRERSADTARAVANSSFDVPVFVGVEIASRAGDLLVFPRVIDPVLSREEWRELNALERPELDDVVAWAQRHDAVVLLAHPYDRDRRGAPRDRVYVFDGIAGVEIGTDDADPTSNRVALEAIGRSELPAFAGSARRTGAGDGQWLTLLARSVSSQSELVDALRAGDFWAVQVGRGPERKSPPRDRSERSDRSDRNDRKDRGNSGKRGDRGPRRR
jgi:predicted metal-dependent phosphoesterase TrpH